MQDDYSRVARTLCWACTGRLSPEDCPEDLLLSAVSAHKAAGRLLARAANGRWRVPGAVVAAVRDLYRAQMSAVHKIEDDLRRLTAWITTHPEWDRRPFLVVKGNAAHYLTGIEEARRFTADIDLVTSDPARYQAIIEGLGYRAGGDNFGGHEAANLALAGFSGIDLHAYCPSWRYPAAPYRERVAGGRETVMTDWIRGDALTYEDVLHGSVPHPTVGSPWLRVPDATTSALILCLEIFRDYVVGSQDVASVRLADLCEVVELRHSSGFDAARFLDLVERCRAGDSLSFVGYAVDRLFDRRDVLALDVEERTSHPRMIGIGQLFEVENHFFDFLVRRDTFGDLFRETGSNDVLTSERSSVIRVRASGATVDGRPAFATRSRPLAPASRDLDFDCVLTRRADALVLEVNGLYPVGRFREVVKVYLEHDTIVTGYDGYRSALRLPPPTKGVSAAWDTADGGWTLRLELPVAKLRANRTSAGQVPAIVHCCSFTRPPGDSWDDYYRYGISSASVPLTFPVD